MLRISNLIESTLAGIDQKALNYSIAIWNFTNRCNLSCKHCYSKASVDSRDALSTEDILKTIPSLYKAGIRFIIFSGGEPLLRKDIFEIAKICRKNGIITYLSTNGIYINDDNIDNIISTFNYIGISIDGDKDVHDEFRGMKGAFDKSIEAILKLLEKTENVGLRFTLTKETLRNLRFIFNFVEKYRIPKLYISHLVYAGRGFENQDMDISKRERRRVINFILDKAFYYYRFNRKINIVTGNMEQDGIMLLKRFKRDYPEYVDKIYENLIKWGGNSAGVKLVNIDSEGNVKPDPFFPYSIGNIKEREFEKIWNDKENPILKILRQRPRKLEGRCKKCAFVMICNGGSRSRAFAKYGTLTAEDPSCYLNDKEVRGIL
ncbi:MAG: radical SAM protein [Hydrogenothermaceae bacterium]